MITGKYFVLCTDWFEYIWYLQFCYYTYAQVVPVPFPQTKKHLERTKKHNSLSDPTEHFLL